MERVKWEKPRAEVQAFVADDYVAACYSLICEFDSGALSSTSNGSGKLGVSVTRDGDTREIHDTIRAESRPSITTNGFIQSKGWRAVYYWKTNDGKYHASTGYVSDTVNRS